MQHTTTSSIDLQSIEKEYKNKLDKINEYNEENDVEEYDDGMTTALMRLASLRHEENIYKNRDRRITEILQSPDQIVTSNEFKMPVGSYATHYLDSNESNKPVRRGSVSVSMSWKKQTDTHKSQLGSNISEWQEFRNSQLMNPEFHKLRYEVMWWAIKTAKFCGFVSLNIIPDDFVIKSHNWKRTRRIIQFLVNWSWFFFLLLSLEYVTAWQFSRFFTEKSLGGEDTNPFIAHTATAMYVGVDLYGIGILFAGVLLVKHQRIVYDNFTNFMAHVQLPKKGALKRDNSMIDVALVLINNNTKQSDNFIDSLTARQIHFREWRRLQISVNTSLLLYTVLAIVTGSFVVQYVLGEDDLYVHEQCREKVNRFICDAFVTWCNYIFTIICTMFFCTIWIACHILHRSAKHLRHAIVDIINEGHKHPFAQLDLQNLVGFLGDWLKELSNGKKSLEKYLLRFIVPFLFVAICGLVVGFSALLVLSNGTFPEDTAVYTAPCIGLLLWSLLLACLSRFFRIYAEIDELMFLLFCPEEDGVAIPNTPAANINKKSIVDRTSIIVPDSIAEPFRPSISQEDQSTINKRPSSSDKSTSTRRLRSGSFVSYVVQSDLKSQMEMFKRQQQNRKATDSALELPINHPENQNNRISISFNATNAIPYERMVKWGMIANAYEPAPQVANRTLNVYLDICKRVVIGIIVGTSCLCARLAMQYPRCVKLDTLSENNNDDSCSYSMNTFRIFEDILLSKSIKVLSPMLFYFLTFGIAEFRRLVYAFIAFIIWLIVQLSMSLNLRNTNEELLRIPSDVCFLIILGATAYVAYKKIEDNYNRYWIILASICLVIVVNLQRFLVIFQYNRAANDDERVVIIFVFHPIMSIIVTTVVTSIMRTTHKIPSMKNHFVVFSVIAFVVYPIQRFYIINLSSVLVQLKSSILLAFVEVISRTISLFMPYVFWFLKYRSHDKAMAEIELTRLHVINRHHICINMMVEVYSILVAPIFTQIVRAIYDQPLIDWGSLLTVLLLQLVFSVVGDVLAISIESVYLERKVLPLWNYFLHTGRYLKYGLLPATIITSLWLTRDMILVILSVVKT